MYVYIYIDKETYGVMTVWIYQPDPLYLAGRVEAKYPDDELSKPRPDISTLKAALKAALNVEPKEFQQLSHIEPQGGLSQIGMNSNWFLSSEAVFVICMLNGYKANTLPRKPETDGFQLKQTSRGLDK